MSNAFIVPDLERYSGLLALHTGKFGIALKHILRSLEIYETFLPVDSPVICYLNRDLSNVAASIGKPDLALSFAISANLSRIDALESRISRIQISTLVGRTSAARILCQRAIEESCGEDSWATLAL